MRPLFTHRRAYPTAPIPTRPLRLRTTLLVVAIAFMVVATLARSLEVFEVLVALARGL